MSSTLASRIDRNSPAFADNAAAFGDLVDALNAEQSLARAGGGAKAVERHRSRSRLLVHERIDLLLDEDAPFLEFSTLAAYGTQFRVGASMVTGIGVVSGTEVVIIAHDPTVRAGATNPYGWKKIIRAMQIARENRLPVVNLVESAGGDLPSQAELFLPAGRLFHDLTQLSALGIPTIALVFGNSTAGGAYVPGMCDYAVLVRRQAKVFLGGPPLVKMATGEDADDESLGGADMHARTSGLADYVADDEHECIRIGRDIIANLEYRKLGYGPTATPEPPLHDAEDLLGIASVNLKVPFDPREVIARIVDGSRFHEYKPLYGAALVTGWAHVHGYRVGILANAHGVLQNEESHKATEFILLANQNDTPLIFLQNTTGYIVGTAFEQRGIIKDGAKMINAVANSAVPHITILMGASYGAGNYGMSGRAYDPRFLFSWPNAKTAVMGPEQLAGVLSIVAREAAAKAGTPFDEEADAKRRAATEAQIEAESLATYLSARLHDDGIIDPRDTRDVLGIALSACHSNVVEGRRGFGVFRM